MRLPRVRFTVRWMLMAIAVASLLCLAGREFWDKWTHHLHPNLAYPSWVTGSAGWKTNLSMAPGESIPVSIRYDFRFGRPPPKPGTTCLLLAQVWFEDSQTHSAVEGYSFDAELTVGERESCSGSFDWNAVLPHPGPYMLRYMLYYQDDQGRLSESRGGGKAYNVVTGTPSKPTSSEPGARP